MRLTDDIIPIESQLLIRETRLIQNRTYLATSSHSRLAVLLAAELALALNCIVGDYFIFRSMAIIDLVRSRVGLSERLVRALMDSASHFTVAFLSWFIATYAASHTIPNGLNRSYSIKELLIVGLMASLIDIDHFLAAKSTSLLKAISLPKRPFLHNSLTLLICNVLIYVLVSIIRGTNEARKLSAMFFTAWFTHHVRDANRRGMWFGILFTTRPLSRGLYLSTTLVVPLLMRYNLFYYCCAWLTMTSSSSSSLATVSQWPGLLSRLFAFGKSSTSTAAHPTHII